MNIFPFVFPRGEQGKGWRLNREIMRKLLTPTAEVRRNSYRKIWISVPLHLGLTNDPTTSNIDI